ncbi:ABC transporter permease [Compostimonas suwonensis]|uniref:NitT/TauT family transport system permease protein n=1 Tax=Compostimonas suwonensis TaxID=1048394 RepID=A0A2M9BBP5_9MICO|nr:ABC transporter permease [Compostimonas suwonensis]PJJ55365.1 NitT/TauT family transport system permease protein [Compostimonas suwonensis]
MTATVTPPLPATDVASTKRSRRGRKLSRTTIIGRWVAALLFVALLLAWELGGLAGGQRMFSRPTLVVERFIDMVATGDLWHNLFATVWAMLGGLVIGMVVGVVLGVLMGKFAIAGTIFDPYVIGINGLPRVALGPFLVVWFGIGLFSKMILAASLVFVGVLFNVREGVESVDKDLVDAMRSMRASRWELTKDVLIPSLAPWLFAALKVAIGFALTGAVIGELVGASEGLGWYISNALSVIDITGAVTALVLLALLALVMYLIVIVIERRYLHWRSAAR